MTKAEENPTVHAAYKQGRTAARNGISKDEAPHNDDTDEHKAWLRGWKVEHKVVDAPAVHEPKAGHQMGVTSSAKKG